MQVKLVNVLIHLLASYLRYLSFGYKAMQYFILPVSETELYI